MSLIKVIHINPEEAEMIFQARKMIHDVGPIGIAAIVARKNYDDLRDLLQKKYKIDFDDYFVTQSGVLIPHAKLLNDRELLEAIYEEIIMLKLSRL